MKPTRMPAAEAPARTILLAEVDDEVRESLAVELRHDGYQVITIGDGPALCDYLELAAFSNGKIPAPDLIVSDVELPGYGGLAVCRMISGPGSPPIILLAGSPDSWEQAERAGAAHVLDKPVNLEELHDAIACYLEEE